jgi:hypothetical protein
LILASHAGLLDLFHLQTGHLGNANARQCAPLYPGGAICA